MLRKTHRFSNCFSLEIENGISPTPFVRRKVLENTVKQPSS